MTTAPVTRPIESDAPLASADVRVPRGATGPAPVLFTITSTGFGGAESSLYELARRLDRDRFMPIVCSLCPLGETGHAIRELGVEVFSLDMSRRATPLEVLRGAERLARTIDERRIRVVQSMLYRANLVAALAVRRARSAPPLVSGQRSLAPRGAWIGNRLVRVTRRFATVVVAVSEPVREEVLSTEGLSQEQVLVIENGVDTERYRPSTPTRAREARERLAIPDGAYAVGAAGRFSPSKGVPWLLEAVARLSPERRVLLLLAGDGPDRGSLEQRARDLGIADRVRFLGFVGDLRAFYAALDVYVLPSIAEGSPNALLEAMAAGAPVVASRVGGVPGIVGADGAGVLVPPADATALAAALDALAADRPRRAALAAAARVRAELFSVARMVRRYEALYADLLARRAGESG